MPTDTMFMAPAVPGRRRAVWRWELTAPGKGTRSIAPRQPAGCGCTFQFRPLTMCGTGLVVTLGVDGRVAAVGTGGVTLVPNDDYEVDREGWRLSFTAGALKGAVLQRVMPPARPRAFVAVK